MAERFNVGGITCICEVNNDEIIITGFDGNDSRIIIPEKPFADRPDLVVTVIGKKAFLGAKFLKEVSLPGTIKSLEDWAFSGCTHLKSLTVRESVNGARPAFGKAVFDNCEELERVLLGYDEPDDMSILLGAAIWRLPAPYLFMDPDIGSDSWFVSWDKALSGYLKERDDEGYTNSVLCGEEDISYDGIGSVDGELLSDGTNYLIETRKRKCFLCFLRLMASEKLSLEQREVYITYLKEHSKGKKSEEAWTVLKGELKGRIEFLKLFASIGALEVDRIDEMLEDVGEDYAEGKAFLIKYKQDNTKSSDFFDGLLL